MDPRKERTMSMLKRPVFAWTFTVSALVASAAVYVGALSADTPARLRAAAGGPTVEPLTEKLPPVARKTMAVEPKSADDLFVLSFDDGTCESGLGVGTTVFVTDFVDFDVPATCVQAGFAIVGVTTRLNTGQSIQTFAFGQSGATPPPVTGINTARLRTAIPAVGPCPATTLTSRTIEPSDAVITATANFFAGVRAAGIVGRDTNGPPAGRIWLNCATCGMTQYSPTTLFNLGLGGNWMIRVVVENPCTIPVELMDFTVSDG